MFGKDIAFAATAASLLLLAGAASAGPKWVEVDDRETVILFEVSADTVDDWNVHDEAGNRIGEVEEVVGPARDMPTALVIEFDARSTYPADGEFVVPLERFKRADGRLILKVDPSAIASMERYTG